MDDIGDSRAGPAQTMRPAAEVVPSVLPPAVHVLWLRARGTDTLVDFVLGDSNSLPPSDAEVQEAIESLALKWVPGWRLYARRVRRALAHALTENESTAVRFGWRGLTKDEMKRRALSVGLLLALNDARPSQQVKLGRDQVISWGSDLIRRQEQDLMRAARGEVTEALLQRLSAPPVGVPRHARFRRLGPIEAVMLGFDLHMVRPTDLHPGAFEHWLRRRAYAHAETWLLEEAGLLKSADALDRRPLRIGQPERAAKTDRWTVTGPEFLKAVGEVSPGPLDALIAAECLQEVLAVVTPGQREILLLLRDDLKRGLSVSEAKRSVAEHRGTGRNLMDVALHNVRKCVKDPR